MTAREVFEGMLTELNKVNAPSLLLLDFNYFFNKAINLYINKSYNVYDINQQYSDNVRVLKSTAFLEPRKSNIYNKHNATSKLSSMNPSLTTLQGATYEVDLPDDYLHLLNCICTFRLNKRHKCYDAGSYVSFAAKRLTADSWSTIINDWYNRPAPHRPYYYIHNVNTFSSEPTNPYNPVTKEGTDQVAYDNLADGYYYVPVINEYVLSGRPVPANSLLYKAVEKVVNENVINLVITVTDGCINFKHNSQTYLGYVKLEDKSVEFKTSASDGYGILNAFESSNGLEFDRTITLNTDNTNTISLVDKPAYVRHSNPSNVRCEIRYGKDSSVYELVEVQVDYIKSPQHIRLTQEQLDLTEDTSQIMEFPDYVCQEIINELVHLVMENTGDPRLQTHIPVSLSIANPAQQLTQSK